MNKLENSHTPLVVHTPPDSCDPPTHKIVYFKTRRISFPRLHAHEITLKMPWQYVKDTIAKSECSPPAAGSTVTKNRVLNSILSGIVSLNICFKRDCLKHWSTLLKATPPISELIRSGRSLMIIFSRRCLSASCHRGIKCCMCKLHTEFALCNVIMSHTVSAICWNRANGRNVKFYKRHTIRVFSRHRCMLDTPERFE